MTGPSPTARKPVSTATLILIAAAIIAITSAAVALTRGTGESAPAAAPATAKAEQPAPTIEQSIAALEGRLRQDPDNPVDWRLLGWSYFEMGDLMRSANAYRHAAQVEPDNAENWSSLGEALQTASQAIQPEAKTAFERALRIDPKDARSRYFLAVQKDLAGQHEAAIGDWIALLKDTPAGAPWEADLRRTIGQVAAKEKIDVAGRLPPPRAAPVAAPGAQVATAAIPGPTAQQMAAASSMTPGQQDEMVQAMVGRLAARLQANPKDADGWIRLMRARMVLGDTAAAQAALRSGRAAFQGDQATQARLSEAAGTLGVPGAG